MDREQAHKHLGLYLGATNSQIDAKVAELTQDARAKLKGDALESRVQELRLARDTALGKPTMVLTAPAKPPLLRRGPVVLLMIVLALAVAAGLFFLAAGYLDGKQAERRTGEQRTRAVSAHETWEGYRASQGIGQTPDSERAEAQFNGAQTLFEEGDYANAAQDYETALQLYNAAFAAEDARITQAWQRDVLDMRRENLAGRFPFDPEAEAEAEADDVARMLNPASGALWTITREFDALAVVELEGRRFGTPLKEREELTRSGTRLRDALFGDHSPTIDVHFAVRAYCPRSMSELRLEVGGATSSTRKEDFEKARWTQARGGMTLTLNIPGGDKQDSTFDKSASDWGLLHALAFGEFTGERDGYLVWEFNPNSVSGKRIKGKEAAIHIKLEDGRNPFDLAIYGAFVR